MKNFFGELINTLEMCEGRISLRSQYNLPNCNSKIKNKIKKAEQKFQNFGTITKGVSYT